MKTNNKNYDLNVLKADSLKEFLFEYENYSDIDTAITEIADSFVPIYNYDLLQYVANNSILGHAEEQANIKDIYSFISMNIFYELEGHLLDSVNQLRLKDEEYDIENS